MGRFAEGKKPLSEAVARAGAGTRAPDARIAGSHRMPAAHGRAAACRPRPGGRQKPGTRLTASLPYCSRFAQDVRSLSPALPLDDLVKQCLPSPTLKAAVEADEFNYDVRGKTISGSNYRESLPRLQIPKIAAPQTSDFRFAVPAVSAGHSPDNQFDCRVNTNEINDQQTFSLSLSVRGKASARRCSRPTSSAKNAVHGR